jgi:5-methylcytosine-specific restriction protein A
VDGDLTEEVDLEGGHARLGEGFIDCHHAVLLGQGSECVTSLSDLALLCPNCHRMVHRPVRPLTVADLRVRLAESVSRRPLGHDQAMKYGSGA